VLRKAGAAQVFTRMADLPGLLSARL